MTGFGISECKQNCLGFISMTVGHDQQASDKCSMPLGFPSKRYPSLSELMKPMINFCD